MSERVKCPQCERNYEVKYRKLPARDQDKFTCKCGHILKKWNDTHVPDYIEIKDE